jgi:hypothetical protein
MINPNRAFVFLRQAIIDIHDYFKREFKQRGVTFYEEETDPSKILNSRHFFRREYAYDFHFSGKYDRDKKQSIGVLVSFDHTGEKCFLRFDWSVIVNEKRKELFSKTDVFLSEKITKVEVLDLMSDFLKHKIEPDKKSRQEFLYKIKKATE